MAQVLMTLCRCEMLTHECQGLMMDPCLIIASLDLVMSNPQNARFAEYLERGQMLC